MHVVVGFVTVKCVQEKLTIADMNCAMYGARVASNIVVCRQTDG